MKRIIRFVLASDRGELPSTIQIQDRHAECLLEDRNLFRKQHFAAVPGYVHAPLRWARIHRKCLTGYELEHRAVPVESDRPMPANQRERALYCLARQIIAVDNKISKQ